MMVWHSQSEADFRKLVPRSDALLTSRNIRSGKSGVFRVRDLRLNQQRARHHHYPANSRFPDTRPLLAHADKSDMANA